MPSQPCAASGRRNLLSAEIRAALLGLVPAAIAWGGLRMLPEAGVEVFARGAATLAALLSGSHLARVPDGWLLSGAAQPVVVTEACSATGYFVTVAALLGWRLARAGRRPARVVALALVSAFPLTLAVNALRVVVLMQAHRWVIPRFPDAYGPFLHLLTGVAVFLPALIGLNLFLEFHGNTRRSSG